MVEFETRGLESFFTGSSYGEIESDAAKDIMRVCAKLLKGGYGSKFKLGKNDIKYSRIPTRSVIGQISKLSAVKGYRKGSVRDPVVNENAKLLLKYMVEMNYLQTVYVNSSLYYMLTENSASVFSDDDEYENGDYNTFV